MPWRRDWIPTPVFLDFPSDSDGEESACNAGDLGLIPELERSSGGGHGNPLQYSCLKNPMDSGDWWATVQSFAELDMTEVIEHTRTNFRIQALGHLETRPLSGRRQMAVIWFAFQKLVEDAV